MYLCLKNAIDKHGLRMRIFFCQFCACVYFAASLDNCIVSPYCFNGTYDGFQSGLATGFYCRYYPPVKAGPDNTHKSGFFPAFTIFLLFSSTETVLSILYVY